jgi:chromate transport protein ChrA
MDFPESCYLGDVTNWLEKLKPRQEPPGVETTLLRRMPAILILGSLAPVVVHLLASAWLEGAPGAAKQILSIDIFLAAAVATFWTAVVTVTLACIIISIMKGPAYVADAYPVNDASRPGKRQFFR